MKIILNDMEEIQIYLPYLLSDISEDIYNDTNTLIYRGINDSFK